MIISLLKLTANRALLPYLSQLELLLVVQVRLLEAGSCPLALACLRGQSEGEGAGLLCGGESRAGADQVGDGGELLIISHHTGRSGPGSATQQAGQ